MKFIANSLNRLYASGITKPNISLTTFVDLKYVIFFFFMN